MFHVSLKVRSLNSFTTVVVGTILSFRGAGQTVLLYGNEKKYELVHFPLLFAIFCLTE